MLVISSLRRGGAERVMTVLANYWVNAGHDVHLVTIEGMNTDSYAVRAEIHRIALGLGRRSNTFWGGLYNNAKRLWCLRTAVRCVHPDIVVSFVTHTNLLVLMALLGCRVPVIVSERVDPSQVTLTKLRRWLRARLYPRADAVVMQTMRAASWMGSTLSNARLTVIPNPIAQSDPDDGCRYVPVREALQLPRESRLVAGMGRLDPQKGFDLLIRAFAELSPRFAGWNLVIFGEGPFRRELEDQVSRLQLQDRIFLPGAVVSPRRCLAEVDVFVMSSRYEGFPNALLEAMACGRAVVSFDCVSGPAEIIEPDYNGFLVEPGNVAALTAAMSAFMSSPRLRERLGGSARQVVSRFSIERTMAEWDGLLQSVVARTARGL